MLYITIQVNGVPVKAFVDSGAQTTIMSRECATKCDFMNQIDPRFGGEATGVGTVRILGKIHHVPISIRNESYHASFSVIEEIQNEDVLIGLDFLAQYKCSIDLRNNVLHFGVSDQSAPFLSEAEQPEHAEKY